MSATVSSRPPSPLLAALGRAALASRFIATVLVTIVSVRFAVASFERALDNTSMPSRPAASAPKAVAAAPGASLVRTHGSPAASASALARSGESRRIQLGISSGPGRSEIYVNGRLLGNSPFLGDTSCKTGLPLRIEVVPPRGPPLVYERECRGTVIEITGPPP